MCCCSAVISSVFGSNRQCVYSGEFDTLLTPVRCLEWQLLPGHRSHQPKIQHLQAGCRAGGEARQACPSRLSALGHRTQEARDASALPRFQGMTYLVGTNVKPFVHLNRIRTDNLSVQVLRQCQRKLSLADSCGSSQDNNLWTANNGRRQVAVGTSSKLRCVHRGRPPEQEAGLFAQPVCEQSHHMSGKHSGQQRSEV